jgi:hypothetical protein
MRFLRFALCVACLPLAGLRAAEDEKPVPEEIPNFNQLDEYIYVPKQTLSLGTRLFLNGPKATYGGQGSIPSGIGDLAGPTFPNISRTYADGQVNPDTRTISVNTGIGVTQQEPISPDGRTNSWSYANSSQLQPNGDINFHIYSGQVTDTGTHQDEATPSVGLELIFDRDMGKLGKKWKWSFTAGFSIADIHSSTFANVGTTLTTLTDTYDLFGQVPPPAPFTSPGAISQTALNSSGQAVGGSTATTTQEAGQTILIGNRPIQNLPGNGETIVNTDVFSTNRYFIEGAYYTLRVGPTLIMPINSRLRLTLSAGPALIYAGSEYNVLEDLVYATGEPALTQLYQKENTKLLPGYYVDVNLRYDLTETAGFYVGGIYQGAGSYSQSMTSGSNTAYTTKVDFGSEEGVKGGLTVRF